MIVVAIPQIIAGALLILGGNALLADKPVFALIMMVVGAYTLFHSIVHEPPRST